MRGKKGQRATKATGRRDTGCGLPRDQLPASNIRKKMFVLCPLNSETAS